MMQGERFDEEKNREPFPYNPVSIQALIVTHAHLDHIGRIPKLVKEGFHGVIYSTPQTKELAELVLTDAAGILALEARQDGVAPLFDLNDIRVVFLLWRTIRYHENLEIVPGISILLKDAGHILGSAMVEISAQVRKRASTQDGSDTNLIRILFTGDLGNSPAPLLQDTESIGDIDYLIMESVYGDRNHESKEQRVSEFERVIKKTIAYAGTLVIPTFSIDRTQVLLYELNNMVEQKKIPSIPIFVDSPMAIKATKIYAENTDLFNDYVRNQIAKGDDIFDFKNLEFIMSQNESRDIDKIKGAKIILAGSGMSVGGRVTGHEETYLPDSKNTILLVGYQTVGSLGRRLADGAKKVHIHKQKVQIHARIEKLYGYSAHKDSDHLLGFVSNATNRLKQVFVTMGEPKASMFLAQKINEELKVKAVVPKIGDKVNLQSIEV